MLAEHWQWRIWAPHSCWEVWRKNERQVGGRAAPVSFMFERWWGWACFFSAQMSGTWGDSSSLPVYFQKSTETTFYLLQIWHLYKTCIKLHISSTSKGRLRVRFFIRGPWDCQIQKSQIPWFPKTTFNHTQSDRFSAIYNNSAFLKLW